MDRLYKQIVLEHIQQHETQTMKERQFASWRSLTRQLLRNYDLIELEDTFEECIIEASDDDYFEQKVYDKMNRSIAISEGKKRNPKVKGVVREEIDKRLKITDIARKFGHEVDTKGKILCPFHADGDPSCSLNDEKNIFHCFGCGVSGDIIEFYRRLKDGAPRSSQTIIE